MIFVKIGGQLKRMIKVNKKAYWITFITLLALATVKIQFVDDGDNDIVINITGDWSFRSLFRGFLIWIGIETISDWVGKKYYKWRKQ